MSANFTCPRTCRTQEPHDRCRFQAVFAALGVGQVNSHTQTVKTAVRDEQTLRAAAARLNLQILGHGCHALFQGPVSGFAVQIPGWRYPVVFDLQKGKIYYDNYNGRWGAQAQLDRLLGEYTLEAAARAADQQGWLWQRDGDHIVIYHPSGGTLTVAADGRLDAAAFVGDACHTAAAPIAAAVGDTLAVVPTAEARPVLVGRV